ncbi:zinc finger MYM-type protein 1-like [Pyrus x bretschneideri]|uniref:zinc finger MYM-type protein 1-like n=1 Tax=Pyrus x bretschneideri TaxID=225117 RepID=UPI00203079A9|nr:zinc finger MYM-type protein 1-like [Pyrus x bretschneideri]
MNQNQHIKTIVHKQSDQACIDYRTRLNASIDCIHILLRQGLAFHGQDESEDSSNKGNFLELLKFLADHNEGIKDVVFKNAPENLKLTSPEIQKDLVYAATCETTNAIMFDIGDDVFFFVLVDESRDISVKEQMAVVLRYVNTNGQVVERFMGIKHIRNTTVFSLKEAIDQFFSINGLSISRLQGQDYDGAGNMQGEFNGLKTLILKENESAFYIHCFAHQLQLALVAVSKNHTQIGFFFCLVNNVVTIVGASCKRQDMVRERQQAKVMEAIQNYELPSGQGLNQETCLKRASDTRWGSHYSTLVSLINMFSFVIEVLEMIVDDGVSLDQRGEADILLNLLQ